MTSWFGRGALVVAIGVAAAASAKPWNPDLGKGTYKNPIIFADYSDPDVVRAGDDFYLTSSSFASVPGLPILYSRDLVHWQIVNHALPRLPDPAFDRPQHGNGVWAPSIRIHDGWFYIYWGDPDRGIYMVRTKDPRGEWSAPTLVKKAYGNIDPCPLWDDDGKAYLVHAFAHSRAGVKSMLQIDQLSPDGTKVIDKGTIVFDGHKDHPTIEGPKFYKRNGYYYIFAPAGGVPTGWQTVLRSKNVYGPYEDRIVMSQGNTPINGPHQGGLVELENGESWFLHFQDRGPYGRIVHLQPVKWVDDWPVIGDDSDGDGTGQPVLDHTKPSVGSGSDNSTPQQGDEFDGKQLSLAWQWQANPRPDWFSLADRPGWLRLRSVPTLGGSLWEAPNLLLQKFAAPEFVATTKLDFSELGEDSRAGLVVMGQDYAALSVRSNGKQRELTLAICKDADRGKPETIAASLPIDGNTVWLRVEVKENAACRFASSQDGSTFKPIGKPFQARAGQWIGATVGLFCQGDKENANAAYADFDFLRVE